jgi:hypothetical protein
LVDACSRSSLLRAVALSSVLVLALLAIGLVPGARPALAASFTYTVTDTTDAHAKVPIVDFTRCQSDLPDNACTLRAAFETAQAAPAASSVTINVNAGAYTLAKGPLALNRPATIGGAGASTTNVSGNDASTVLVFGPGATVTLSKLTVSHGKAATVGGGIVNVGDLTLNDVAVTDNSAAFGGGIVNGGALTVNRGAISMNHAVEVTVQEQTVGGVGGGIFTVAKSVAIDGALLAGNTAAVAAGGVLAAGGTLAAAHTTLADNSADALGGAMVTYDRAAVTIITSTFSGNTASGKDAAAGGGGGIFNVGAALHLANDTFDRNATTGHGGAIAQAVFGTRTATDMVDAQHVTAAMEGVSDTETMPLRTLLAQQTEALPSTNLDFVTISENKAPDKFGGGIALGRDSGAVTVHDTIVANNPGKNCFTPVTSAGFNLDSANDCGFAGTGDLTGQNPNLQGLAANGGPTQTMALVKGSPAVDAADPKCGVSSDQRGVTRPQGLRCDIGAFELQVQAPVPAPPVTGLAASVSGGSGLPIGALALLLLFAAVGAGLIVRRRGSA